MDDDVPLSHADRDSNSTVTDRLKVDWTLLWLPCLLLVAHLPFLTLHFAALWEKPHYQYFPFLLVALAWLTGQRWSSPSGMDRNRSSWAFGKGTSMVMGFSLLVLLAALLNYSPLLAAISLVIAIGGLMRWLTDQGRLEKPFGLWCLFWLLIPLPSKLDSVVDHWLHGVTTAVSSKLLDIAGKIHLTEGHTLVLTRKTFFVDQIGSGMCSLMGMFAVMLVSVAPSPCMA